MSESILMAEGATIFQEQSKIADILNNHFSQRYKRTGLAWSEEPSQYFYHQEQFLSYRSF